MLGIQHVRKTHHKYITSWLISDANSPAVTDSGSGTSPLIIRSIATPDCEAISTLHEDL